MSANLRRWRRSSSAHLDGPVVAGCFPGGATVEAPCCEIDHGRCGEQLERFGVLRLDEYRLL